MIVVKPIPKEQLFPVDDPLTRKLSDLFSPRFGGLKARCPKNIYRVPLMGIQTLLVEMSEDPRIRKLISWLEKNSKPNRWRLEFSLEAQWYPELVTNDRWLAAAFIRTFPQTKAETAE